MKEVGYLSEEDYERAVNAPFKIVQQESEGTDENYQSSYAIHCAALELMKKDNFQSSMYLKIKKIIHSIQTGIQQLILKNPTRSAAEALRSILHWTASCKTSSRPDRPVSFRLYRASG